MKVVVLGAGGIVGQHMLITAPDPHKAVFCRREPGVAWTGVDLADWTAASAFLDGEEPDVVVNLAGENRVDVVEAAPAEHRAINVDLPGNLVHWCDLHGAHLVHASTQGIFDGENPPYGPDSSPSPITEYGWQKVEAEARVREGLNWTIARLTFVLGVRPFPGVGRPNPLEQMLTEPVQVQVNDRWFSPLFANDAAAELWRLVDERPRGEIIHLGNPIRVSRYSVAGTIIHATHSSPEQAPAITPVSHEYFKGIAPRPRDTTWRYGSRYATDLEDGILDAYLELGHRDRLSISYRARELALFLGLSDEETKARLAAGFHAAHKNVADDFLRDGPRDDADLLDWYVRTDAYIWELSAYHLDPGFNYMGMCEGFATHLANLKARRVLCLGDGIGDLTLALARRGLRPSYHDLGGSRTQAFATFRFGLNAPELIPDSLYTLTWEPPPLDEEYDAIVALDFFEHLVNVEDWVRACIQGLRPGGWFFAQNAFAIGDAEHGNSIPMHLSRNNRFEHDWSPLLSSLGLEPADGGWWRK